eukprot:bmy_09012T0
MEAMCRQDPLQPFNKSSKLSPAAQQRSVVFPQTPCGRNFSLLDKSGPMESGFNQINVKNQRVLASPTSTSQLHSEFSDWHLWKCGQCFKTFTQRILLQMHVCTQNPDRFIVVVITEHTRKILLELEKVSTVPFGGRGSPERGNIENLGKAVSCLPYQCGHCSQSFSQPSELRNHVVTHSSDRPFKCGYCGRAFAGATTLNNHIRTHTGEKPFKFQERTLGGALRWLLCPDGCLASAPGSPDKWNSDREATVRAQLAAAMCERCERSFTQATQLSRHQRMPNECKPITESPESIEVD